MQTLLHFPLDIDCRTIVAWWGGGLKPSLSQAKSVKIREYFGFLSRLRLSNICPPFCFETADRIRHSEVRQVSVSLARSCDTYCPCSETTVPEPCFRKRLKLLSLVRKVPAHSCFAGHMNSLRDLGFRSGECCVLKLIASTYAGKLARATH